MGKVCHIQSKARLGSQDMDDAIITPDGAAYE